MASSIRRTPVPARDTLAAFIDLVEAHQSKGIDAASANLLILYAGNLIMLVRQRPGGPNPGGRPAVRHGMMWCARIQTVMVRPSAGDFLGHTQ